MVGKNTGEMRAAEGPLHMMWTWIIRVLIVYGAIALYHVWPGAYLLAVSAWLGYVVGNPKRIYELDGTLNMVGYKIVWTRWFGVYVYNILRPDENEEPHDHPWPFLSLILWRGYVEEYITHHLRSGITSELRHHRPGAIVFRRATDAHRVHEAAGAWTLIFVGPKSRDWGYFTSDGWVQWQAFWNQKREHL